VNGPRRDGAGLDAMNSVRVLERFVLILSPGVPNKAQGVHGLAISGWLATRPRIMRFDDLPARRPTSSLNIEELRLNRSPQGLKPFD